MVSFYQRDIDNRALELVAALACGDLRIVTAESCTGGLLAARLAADARLGPHLDRGYVVYSGASKIEVLGADPADVARCDAVNMAVTLDLARGALARSSADIAVAVTGFCGPQQEDEEVGLVHIACVAHRSAPESATFHFGDIGRDQVLQRATAAALALTAKVARTRRASTPAPVRSGQPADATQRPAQPPLPS